MIRRTGKVAVLLPNIASGNKRSKNSIITHPATPRCARCSTRYQSTYEQKDEVTLQVTNTPETTNNIVQAAAFACCCSDLKRNRLEKVSLCDLLSCWRLFSIRPPHHHQYIYFWKINENLLLKRLPTRKLQFKIYSQGDSLGFKYKLCSLFFHMRSRFFDEKINSFLF